jgi:hypothetical protein
MSVVFQPVNRYAPHHWLTVTIWLCRDGVYTSCHDGTTPKDGQDGYDATSGWRHILCWPRGEIKKIKRRLNKALRREGKQGLR